jgi:hypothetical protein
VVTSVDGDASLWRKYAAKGRPVGLNAIVALVEGVSMTASPRKRPRLSLTRLLLKQASCNQTTSTCRLYGDDKSFEDV